MKWIDAGDIKYWVTARRRHCEEWLPELVRRLISATTDTITRIDFPSGDSVTTAGWDGFLETPAVSPFLPAGVSGWELGVERTPQKKADGDYNTRTRNPRGIDRANATFVFVTPRPWPDRGAWEARRKRAKTWKDVRVIAASDLELWLESAPAVALWLARQISKAPTGIRDLEAAWEEWAAATEPVMTPEILCAGRQPQVDALHEWLRSPPGIVEVQADSPDEALAFLFAAIMELEDPPRTRALSRCVVVEDINQLRSCVQFPPIILAAPAECRGAAGLANQKGHHVFLVADSNTIDLRGRLLRLARPRRDLLEAALKKNGFSETDARRLARDSGASIPVLRRRVFRASIAAPDWANAEAAREVVPALLGGAWVDGAIGDRAAMEILSGETYPQFTESLEPLLSVSDAPLRKVGNVWMMKSPLDAWFLTARHLNEEYLGRFRQVAVEVLNEVDPKYELAASDRFAAAVYGKEKRYSSWIRHGLVKSLVLLGVHGEWASARQAVDAAESITEEVLAKARTWEAWSTLSGITPLLAEATPETFMDAVDEVLTANPAVFVELMKDDGGVFGECKHAGLLWALEGLAWDAAYFPRVVRILANLAAIDVGGSWSNRPMSSLRDLFLAGIPQTYAGPELRLAAFAELSKDWPQTAWAVAEHLITADMLTAAHQFQWRPYVGRRSPLEPERPEEHNSYVTGLLPRITALIAARPGNLVAAVKEFARAEFTRDAIVGGLAATDPAVLSKPEREGLVENLRSVLHWINTYGDAATRRYAGDLAGALNRFSPGDPIEKYAWLLGNPWPDMPEGEPREFSEREALVGAKRRAAAREVLDTADVERILSGAASVQYVGVFGHAFGVAIRDQAEDERILDALVAREPLNEGLLVGYAMGRIEASGPAWVAQQVSRRRDQVAQRPEVIANFYLALPEGASTWTEVAAAGASVESAYWKRARGYSRSEAADVVFAVQKLLDVARPEAALRIAGNPAASLPSELLQRLLQDLLASASNDKSVSGTMLKFHLEHVFRQRYERRELSLEELARVEWPFAQVLCDSFGRRAAQPLAIHRVLQRDPSSFALLASMLFTRDDGGTESDKETLSAQQREVMWKNAHAVLRSWDLLPGLSDDGSMDGKALAEWVEAARSQCAATMHTNGGDLQLAEILAKAPADPDGAWPHRAVRDVIETVKSQVLERSIPVAVYNNRGVTTRGIYDGGDQERVLAQRYEEIVKVVAANWPRTGAVLRQLARTYYRDAAHHDTSTDLLDLEG